MEGWKQDIAYALRSLRSAWKFSAAVIVTLALGLGANTAVFDVLNAVVLTPLPYPGADRLVRIYKFRAGEDNYLPGPAALAFRDQSTTIDFAPLYTYATEGADLTDRAEPERVTVLRVGADYFRVLGVQPVLGHPFDRTAERADAGVVVIAERVWREYLGARPDAIGQSLSLNGVRQQVVAVMPDGTADAQALADRILRREERPRQAIVDDHEARRRAIVAGERPAANHLDVERLEETALDHALFGGHIGLGLIDATVAPGVVRTGDWQPRHRARGANASEGVEPILERDVKLGASLRVVIAADRQIDRERHDRLWPDAEVDIRETMETAQQQTGTGDEDHRERHLADHQQLAESRVTPAAAPAAPGFAQHAFEVGPRLMNRGHQSDGHSRRERNQEAKREHGCAASGSRRRAGDRFRRRREQEAREGAGADQSHRTTGEREEDAFEHELPRQPPA